MKNTELRQTTIKHLPLYLITAAIAVLAKYLCRIDDCDAFIWILAPTSRWVSILSGIPFEYLPHTGYINHFYRFVIAPACSGIRFMLITFLMLIFSFLHPASALAKEASIKKSYLWFGFSMLFSYAAAIFVNGIRISASIYFPIILENAGIIGGWLTQDKLHTIIGTLTYFSFLCILYPAAAFICRRGFLKTEKKEHFAPHSSLIPAFWYLLTILVIPALRRIYQQDWTGFGQYGIIVLSICLTVTMLSYLLHKRHSRL